MNAKIRKPVLIVIAGPNGSGKTSVTSKILHHEWMEDSIYINPDIVAQERFGDWNSKEAIMQALKYCGMTIPSTMPSSNCFCAFLTASS